MLTKILYVLGLLLVAYFVRVFLIVNRTTGDLARVGELHRECAKRNPVLIMKWKRNPPGFLKTKTKEIQKTEIFLSIFSKISDAMTEQGVETSLRLKGSEADTLIGMAKSIMLPDLQFQNYVEHLSEDQREGAQQLRDDWRCACDAHDYLGGLEASRETHLAAFQADRQVVLGTKGLMGFVAGLTKPERHAFVSQVEWTVPHPEIFDAVAHCVTQHDCDAATAAAFLVGALDDAIDDENYGFLNTKDAVALMHKVAARLDAGGFKALGIGMDLDTQEALSRYRDNGQGLVQRLGVAVDWDALLSVLAHPSDVWFCLDENQPQWRFDAWLLQRQAKEGR